ncbi:MAG: GntR family transcriptional regulator [Aestuariivirgaceae bacterium]|nr:GntR family transcriptional regulator [Aestuariivirgaceae bacterium]
MATKAKTYGFLGSSHAAPRGSAAARVTDWLRDAIVSMEIKPGEPIDKLALCERLGLSRFPVSEALSRLKDEGLVEIEPQRGTFVSRIRLADARQNLFLRRALEAEAVQELARNMPAEALEDLARNMRYQRAAVEAQDREGFHALDLEFHEILLSALAYPRVKAAVESARSGLDRVRKLLATPRRNSDTLIEHERIFAGLAAANGEQASTAMRAHLDAVMTDLNTLALASPHLFADLETT